MNHPHGSGAEHRVGPSEPRPTWSSALPRRTSRRIKGPGRKRKQLLPPPPRSKDSEARTSLFTAAAADSATRRQLAVGAAVRVAWDGQLRSCTLHELSSLTAVDFDPVRVPPSYHGMGNFVGLHRVIWAGDTWHVWAESLLEWAHLLELDHDPNTALVATQPLHLQWTLGGERLGHVPDILRTDWSRRSTLIDVKLQAGLADPLTRAKFMLTAETARVLGWQYEVRSDLPRRRVSNMRHLAGFKALEGYLGEPVVRPAAVALEPGSASSAVAALGGGDTGRQLLLHLLWHQRLFTDLSQLLTGQSLVWPESQAPAALRQPAGLQVGWSRLCDTIGDR